MNRRYSPYDSPYNGSNHATTGNNNCLVQVIGLLVLSMFFGCCGIVTYLLLGSNDNSNTVVITDEVVEPPLDDPSPIDPEPEKEATKKVALADSYVVRVYETEADQLSKEQVKFLNHVWWLDWHDKNLKGRTSMDPGLEPDRVSSFVDYAKKNNVEVPFLIHAIAGKALSVTPMTDDLTVESFQETILSKAE